MVDVNRVFVGQHFHWPDVNSSSALQKIKPPADHMLKYRCLCMESEDSVVDRFRCKCGQLEGAILETSNNWFLEMVQGSIRQSSCLDVLTVANDSVQKLRDLADAKHFCHKITQPKLLKLLKKTFIERVSSSDSALRDRILSMDDGFEFLLRQRGQEAALEGVARIYNLCTGRNFSPNFDTDPDFVAKLAQRFAEFLSAKQRSSAAFSHASVPQSLSVDERKPGCRFDVFDASFQSQAPQSSEGDAGAAASSAAASAVSIGSEAYTKFLQSDGQSGEIPMMKADWLRRMRIEIVAAEEKYQKLKQQVDAGGKADDPAFIKQKFILTEMGSQRNEMSIDSEEGNVS